VALVDAYTPITAILTDDASATGIRAVVNAATAPTATLGSGSVFVSRDSDGPVARGGKVADRWVAVVPLAAQQATPIGIGTDARSEILELVCGVRAKSLPAGSAPLAIVKEMMRAIVEAYDGRTSLDVSGVTLVSVRADDGLLDPDPETAELVVGTVRTTWRYLQERRDNEVP